MKLRLKLSIVNKKGESFMGIGLVWLLQRIDKLGSISAAAMDMGMSYAKAHRILKTLEKNLGRKILVKSIGGKEHGGARLTPFAKNFIEEYTRLQKKIKLNADKEFSKFLHKVKR